MPVEPIAAATSIEIAFSPSSLRMLNIALAVVMLGVALGLRVEDFSRLVRKPAIPGAGLVSQWLLLPLWTLTLIAIVRPPTGITAGLLLVSCCPGGNVSNLVTDLARGNAALSVSLTLASSLLSVVLTPLVFMAALMALPADYASVGAAFSVDPVDVIRVMSLVILVPLAVGMSVRHFRPEFAEKVRKPMSVLSIVILAAFIVLAANKNRDVFTEHLGSVFLLVIFHNFGALLLGRLWAALLRMNEADSRAISLETGMQNSGLGLLLIFTFFAGNGQMALVAAWWGVWHLISGALVAWYWRRRTPDNTGAQDTVA